MSIDLNTREEEVNREPELAVEESTIEESTITAGQLLHDARIACGLSVKEVSDNINLKLSVIGNIEKDIEDSDISSIFIRGYIRCYARYLKISEADVLAAYDRKQSNSSQQEAELQSFSRRTKQETHDSRLMLASYAILGFMLISFLIWGFQRNDVAVVVPEQNIENSTDVEAGSKQPIDNQIESTDSNIKPRVMPKVTLEEVERMVESFQPTKVEEAPPIIIAPIPVITVEPIVEIPEVITLKATPVIVTDKPTVAEIVELDDSLSDDLADGEFEDVVQGIVKLNFFGDCWVEIKDAQGKVLTVGVRKSGQTLQLQGDVPLNVKLGAPEQVEIRFDGEIIDLSKFRKSRLARFELPM